LPFGDQWANRCADLALEGTFSIKVVRMTRLHGKVYLLLSVGWGLLFGTLAAGQETDRRINALIAHVESAKELVFIRNGQAYPAPEAARHLRLKWQHAGSRVQSVDDFIELCASRSSLSGQPYLIQLPDGQTIHAAQYFKSLAAAKFAPQP
jgi:hypothetical protein